jgi:hypothetical protein
VNRQEGSLPLGFHPLRQQQQEKQQSLLNKYVMYETSSAVWLQIMFRPLRRGIPADVCLN